MRTGYAQGAAYEDRGTSRGWIGAARFLIAGALVAAESRLAAPWMSTAVVVAVALAVLAMPLVRPPRAALDWVADWARRRRRG